MVSIGIDNVSSCKRYSIALVPSHERIKDNATRLAGSISLREVLHPQIGRPLCRVFALTADTWPERVITADLLHEELGAGGVHLIAETSAPIRMHWGGRRRLIRPQL